MRWPPISSAWSNTSRSRCEITAGGRETVYIALGSNLGDRTEHLRTAVADLAGLPGSAVIAASRIEETPPLGGLDQPRYLNQMVLLETSMEPRELLRACQLIERKAGRVRAERWGSRPLDLDIVRYGRRQVCEPDLVIPHPQLPHRDFWLREIAELQPYES